MVKWTKFAESAATWEDYNVIKTRFPDSKAWGQASSPAGGDAIPVARTEVDKTVEKRISILTFSLLYDMWGLQALCIG
jgi:TRAP-type C4-dicarboxylate transport system substrate-binding protein